jgi:septal ring factor EnvC (AmiA/AmiB activator)
LQQATQVEQQESERRLTAMAAEAEDLRDLMARLEEERKRQEQEARDRAAAEKAAREAQVQAAREAKEAALAAEKARQEAAAAQAKAAKERQEAEMVAAREAKKAQDKADVEARAAKSRADQAAREAEHAAAAAAEDQRQAAQRANRPFSRAQGEMPLPARGQVTVHFGQMTDTGAPSKGIVIETRGAAQVIAPYDGQVVFAGPFRGYGLLLIIEHGEGYHTLLSGMDRIDSSVGQRLLAGEPVGVMAQSESKPLLYVELRHNGQPVNPLSWLTTRKTKVSG